MDFDAQHHAAIVRLKSPCTRYGVTCEYQKDIAQFTPSMVNGKRKNDIKKKNTTIMYESEVKNLMTAQVIEQVFK